MALAVDQGRKVWTEKDLESLPEDGFLHEVVNGELIMSPKNNFEHGNICSRLLVALSTFAQAGRLGVVLDSSAGFWMANGNCRAPDVSFVLRERLVKLGFSAKARRFFPGAPDLAIEVLSPSNTPAEMEARLSDFFSSGTQIAWVINPAAESAVVYYSRNQSKVLQRDAQLEGEHLLPGFRYPLAELFKEWDWD